MADSLFPGFLHDPEEYHRAEQLWQKRWQELSEAIGDQHAWKAPWIETSFSNGAQSQDGNPIFSAVCTSRHLGIRVIQREYNGNKDDLLFWTDTFAKGEPEELRELVISCALTPETLDGVLGLMRQWIKNEAVIPIARRPRPASAKA